MENKKTKIFVLLLPFLFLVLVFCLIYAASRISNKEIKEFGVTYSKIFAEELGLDWQKTYEKIFTDLDIKAVRIPVYWQEVEPEKGVFDFSWLDYMVDTAEKYNGKLILVVGRKVPRWPECHEPEWVKSENLKVKSEKLLDYISVVVDKYDNRDVIWAWQVENEPFLKFGICPDYDPYFVDKEIELVRSLSDKSILMTDGGEFGDWFRAYKRADIFGSTLYRHVYTKVIGEWTYPFPPSFFRFRQFLVRMFYGEKSSLVIELQAEPWGKVSIRDISVDEQYKLFGPKRFNKLMTYIKSTGFDTFYFWGVEWWYWLDGQGDSEMLDLVKNEVSRLNQD